MAELTKSQCEELYNQIRRALRHTILCIDKDVWHELRTYEIDYDKEPHYNAAVFVNERCLGTFLNDVKKAGGNIDDNARSKEYWTTITLINLYFMYKQSRILYVSQEDAYKFRYDESKFNFFAETIHNCIKQRCFDKEVYDTTMEYMYELDEEIVKLRNSQRDFRYINEPFMLVLPVDDNKMMILTAEFLSKPTQNFIMYYSVSIIDDNITAMYMSENTLDNIIFDDVLSIQDIDGMTPSIPRGGIFITQINYTPDYSEITSIDYKDNSSHKSIMNQYNRLKSMEEKVAYIGIMEYTTLLFINNTYTVHSALARYMRRNPEVKLVFEKIERMTQESRAILEDEHPRICALDYTKYDYVNEPRSHVSRGGTHASPHEHIRSATMRYNRKTGKKDIYVRGSIVNKDKGLPKTQYYLNKKKTTGL